MTLIMRMEWKQRAHRSFWQRPSNFLMQMFICSRPGEDTFARSNPACFSSPLFYILIGFEKKKAGGQLVGNNRVMKLMTVHYSRLLIWLSCETCNFLSRSQLPFEDSKVLHIVKNVTFSNVPQPILCFFCSPF